MTCAPTFGGLIVFGLVCTVLGLPNSALAAASHPEGRDWFGPLAIMAVIGLAFVVFKALPAAREAFGEFDAGDGR